MATRVRHACRTFIQLGALAELRLPVIFSCSADVCLSAANVLTAQLLHSQLDSARLLLQ